MRNLTFLSAKKNFDYFLTKTYFYSSMSFTLLIPIIYSVNKEEKQNIINNEKGLVEIVVLNDKKNFAELLSIDLFGVDF